MPAPEFVDALNEQVAHEFAASQQYVAVAVHYDTQTLPRLAAFFYAQAVEERGHAMKMVQYLMDQDAEVVIPAVAAPRNGFSGIVEPIQIALDQE
ncbi:MAG: Ferritin Dps family protein, partial [Solirubrobacterales bacterium]|nr:Ferritin Dps family protein [Solirubrobacterales bacterium]